jgi:DNA ligase 1
MLKMEIAPKLWKPMLAGSIPPPFDLSDVKFPVFQSRKLDGVRATVQGGRLMSRSLKPIPNLHCQHTFGLASLEGLDGELIVGSPTADDCYRKTVSVVMSEEDESAVRFFCFDKFDYRLGFRQRMDMALLQLIAAEVFGTMWVTNTQANTPDELLSAEEASVGEGYEGLMIRGVHSPYKQGRSTRREGYLLKLKRSLDAEAVILECIEQLHNGNAPKLNERGNQTRSSNQENMIPAGTLGAFRVRDLSTGIKFKVGTGLDSATCEKVWKNPHHFVDKVIKYKYFPVGVLEKPRHPVFLGFRDPMDMS